VIRGGRIGRGQVTPPAWRRIRGLWSSSKFVNPRPLRLTIFAEGQAFGRPVRPPVRWWFKISLRLRDKVWRVAGLDGVVEERGGVPDVVGQRDHGTASLAN